jgi:hypothetical protein
MNTEQIKAAQAIYRRKDNARYAKKCEQERSQNSEEQTHG